MYTQIRFLQYLRIDQIFVQFMKNKPQSGCTYWITRVAGDVTVCTT